MKKCFGMFLVVVVLVGMCGCNIIDKVTKTKAPDMNVLFECNADIMSDTLEIKSHIRRYGYGYWEMTISEPKTLAGMKIDYRGEEADVSLGDLSFNIKTCDLNNAAIFKLIFDAFDHASVQEEMNLTDSKDGLMMFSQNDNGEYHMIFDSSSGILKFVEIPTYKLSMKISDFCILTEPENPDKIKANPQESAESTQETTVEVEDINALEITDMLAQEVINDYDMLSEEQKQMLAEQIAQQTDTIIPSETEVPDETEEPLQNETTTVVVETEEVNTDNTCNFKMWEDTGDDAN